MNNSANPELTVPPAVIAAGDHPPRAPLVLRIGVIGHRPDPKKRAEPDVQALREICHKLLLQIQDTFAGVGVAQSELFVVLPPRQEGKPAGLRLISALADGADQWVAQEAVKLGYELQAVLPFERNEYEKDFPDPAEYRRLRDQASAVFELDGCRAREGESYLAAGRVLVNQSDLLFAVWDGKDAQGTGGTGQLVREAFQRGIPIIKVNWEAPANWELLQPAWRLLQQPSDIKDDIKLLERKVSELLLPLPSRYASDKPSERDLREVYFANGRRPLTLLGGWWNFFRDLFRGEPGFLQILVPRFIPTTQKEWLRDWEGDPKRKERQHQHSATIRSWVEASYLTHYAWANQLSIFYANYYRSSFIWIFLLGAIAVFLALLGKTAGVSPGKEQLLIIAEVVVIILIIGLTWFGRRRRWHERWIDYRIVAERLRLIRFGCLLGGVWEHASVPSHLATYGNPATTWMHWHARAVERAAGLPNVVVTAEYLACTKELLLEALIVGQEEYHRKNIKRLSSVDHKLHRFGETLFLATLAACAFHLFVALRPELFGHSKEKLEGWLIFCAACLPALGAAMAVVRSQGEFQRVIQRSRAMREELAQLGQAVANVPARPNELNSQLLQQAVEKTTHLMYNEVLDWRIVFQDRPLVWPG